MAITLATGTQVAIASTYGSAVTMTAITNAAEAVATLGAGHGVVVGDFLEVTSGWDRLNSRIVRAKTVATNDITFEAINTTSTSRYPAGTGTGTVRRITAWTQISQITAGIGVTGGDPKFADVTVLSDAIDKQIPVGRTPIQINLPMFYDPGLPWWSTVQAASESATLTALRMIFPDGKRLVANAYWNLQQVPTIEDSTLRNGCSVSLFSDPTVYAS